MEPAEYSRRVLVVDDDPDILTLVGMTLELEGFEVLKAASAKDALECSTVVVVFTDHRINKCINIGLANVDRETVCGSNKKKSDAGEESGDHQWGNSFRCE